MSKLYTAEKLSIASTGRDISLLILRPTENALPKEKTPGVLWLHGGGYSGGNAIEMFAYRTAQLIMEMAQANEGMDTIAFSAGIGENSPRMRAEVAKKLAWMGVELDPELNAIRSDEVRTISTPESKIRVLVVPTNEEYMIALDVAELLG